MGELLRNMAWDAGTALGLSPLHVQLLTHLHGHPPLLAVDLARHFHLTKATVSVALRTLARRRLLEQTPSERDGRVRVIRLTNDGRKAALLAAMHLDRLLPILKAMDATQRNDLYAALYRLLDEARTAGLIQMERMCTTCAHYGSRTGKPYCLLMRARLTPETHRVDCPEHEERRA